MNRNKRIVKAILTVFVVFALETVVCAADDLRPSIPENDYILRSCMSSVELNRRDVHGPKTKSHSPLHVPRRRNVGPPAVQHPIARHPVKAVETEAHGKLQAQSEERMLRRGRPGRQMLADTPLTTLKVERRGRKDSPQLYVKKDLLPEIKSSVDDGRKDGNSEASIVVIKSAPRRSSKR